MKDKFKSDSIMMYGIGEPEDKILPKKRFEDLPGKVEVFPKYEIKTKEITLDKAIKFIQEYLDENKFIRGWIQNNISNYLQKYLKEEVGQFCEMTWCEDIANEILNIIFYGNEKGE